MFRGDAAGLWSGTVPLGSSPGCVTVSICVRRAAHYMTAMRLWRPTGGPGAPGPLPISSCNNCVLCQDCFPKLDKLTMCSPEGGVMLSLGHLMMLYVDNFDNYIPVKFLLFWYLCDFGTFGTYVIMQQDYD